MATLVISSKISAIIQRVAIKLNINQLPNCNDNRRISRDNIQGDPYYFQLSPTNLFDNSDRTLQLNWTQSSSKETLEPWKKKKKKKKENWNRLDKRSGQLNRTGFTLKKSRSRFLPGWLVIVRRAVALTYPFPGPRFRLCGERRIFDRRMQFWTGDYKATATINGTRQLRRQLHWQAY